MIKTFKKLWNITKANTNFPIEHPQVTTRNWLSLLHCFFSCHQAALWIVRSVRLSHLFHYVPIIVSSWNFQELSPMTGVGPMQKVKVKGQGHRYLQFEFTYDDEMMHKAWCCLGEVPYCFHGHPSNFKVTRIKKIGDFDPNWVFPHCNSSLNSLMAMKWCTKLDVV